MINTGTHKKIAKCPRTCWRGRAGSTTWWLRWPELPTLYASFAVCRTRCPGGSSLGHWIMGPFMCCTLGVVGWSVGVGCGNVMGSMAKWGVGVGRHLRREGNPKPKPSQNLCLYPCTVPPHVHVPVPVPVPVHVPMPVPAHVPVHVPVPVSVRVPVCVPVPMPVSVPVPMHVRVHVPVPVPMPVHVPGHVPVPVPMPVPVPVPVPVPGRRASHVHCCAETTRAGPPCLKGVHKEQGPHPDLPHHRAAGARAVPQAAYLTEVCVPVLQDGGGGQTPAPRSATCPRPQWSNTWQRPESSAETRNGRPGTLRHVWSGGLHRGQARRLQMGQSGGHLETRRSVLRTNGRVGRCTGPSVCAAVGP